MEATGEGKDRVIRGARSLVDHGRVDLFGSKVFTNTLLSPPSDEGSLICSLVGIRASGGSEHLVQALGSSAKDSSLEDLGPVGRGEVAQRGTVDDGVDHGGRGGDLGKFGVIVSDGDRGNLGEAGWENVSLCN
jgi:hypothetical protein